MTQTDARMVLTNCEKVILGEIADKKFTQRSVATTYALGIMSEEKIDWGMVNRAIIDRWKQSGLLRIKRAAWKIVEKQP